MKPVPAFKKALPARSAAVSEKPVYQKDDGNQNVRPVSAQFDSLPLVYGDRESYGGQQLQRAVKEAAQTVLGKTEYIKQISEKIEKTAREQELTVRVQGTEKALQSLSLREQEFIREEIGRAVPANLETNINQIANRVYRRLEERLKAEKSRRGLL